MPFRQGDRQRNGVWLGWNAEDNENDDRFYEITLPTDSLSGRTLHLELMQMDQDPPGYEEHDSGLRPAADFIVEFEDAAGQTIQHRITEFGEILPPLPAIHIRDDKLFGLFKMKSMMPNVFGQHQVTEPVMQTISISLEAATEGTINIDEIRIIRLIFDRGAAVIMLDEVSVS